MEFNEKLQELRKSRALTQEELAEALYVSRTAVSKWESGRGYPSIDSLKDISEFFSVSIDDLLSGEKLLSIAENENKSNIRNVCDLLFGFTDLMALILVLFPLYPNTVDGFVYSVNLLGYTQIPQLGKSMYWLMFAFLVAIGALKIIFARAKSEKGNKILTEVSIVTNILTVLGLVLTREVYAVIIVFFMLLAKGLLLFRQIKIK